MLTSIRHALVGWVLVPAIVLGFVLFGAVAVVLTGFAEALTRDRRVRSRRDPLPRLRVVRSDKGDAN